MWRAAALFGFLALQGDRLQDSPGQWACCGRAQHQVVLPRQPSGSGLLPILRPIRGICLVLATAVASIMPAGGNDLWTGLAARAVLPTKPAAVFRVSRAFRSILHEPGTGGETHTRKIAPAAFDAPFIVPYSFPDDLDACLALDPTFYSTEDLRNLPVQ